MGRDRVCVCVCVFEFVALFTGVMWRQEAKHHSIQHSERDGGVKRLRGKEKLFRE